LPNGDDAQAFPLSIPYNLETPRIRQILDIPLGNDHSQRKLFVYSRTKLGKLNSALFADFNAEPQKLQAL
jgi:hypothetical protein